MPTTTHEHTFIAGEIRCPVCLAHRVDCDCPACEPPAAACPAWCTWEHTPAEVEVTDVVMHETRVGQITLSSGEVVAAVVESTDDEPAPVVSFYDAADLTGLNTDDLRALDQLLAGALDRLTQILEG